MSGRTLEEMHSGYVHALLLSEDDEERYCTQNFKDLLAIAQGQREGMERISHENKKMKDVIDWQNKMIHRLETR